MWGSKTDKDGGQAAKTVWNVYMRCEQMVVPVCAPGWGHAGAAAAHCGSSGPPRCFPSPPAATRPPPQTSSRLLTHTRHEYLQNTAWNQTQTSSRAEFIWRHQSVHCPELCCWRFICRILWILNVFITSKFYLLHICYNHHTSVLHPASYLPTEMET